MENPIYVERTKFNGWPKLEIRGGGRPSWARFGGGTKQFAATVYPAGSIGFVCIESGEKSTKETHITVNPEEARILLDFLTECLGATERGGK